MARITLEHITKVEGHASLTLMIRNGKLKTCHLQSIEGSRYFEGLLKGKYYYEASWVSSRICGICSAAHTIATIQAVENAFSLKPSKQTILLRELLTIGERIRSHITHLYFLALPDYLGCDSAIAMANKYKKELGIALKLIKAGNDLMRATAGRDMHPISAVVGGFLQLPKQDNLNELKKQLNNCKDEAWFTFKLFSNLKYPKFESPTEYFSLAKKGEYPLHYGDLISQSTKFKQKDYKKYIEEYHEPYSTSNFVVKENKSYMVGALARLNNNYKFLSKNAKRALKKSKYKFPNKNPFVNNVAQAIETIHFIDRAIDIINKLNIKQEKIIEPKITASHGIAAIEVPRGTLFHEYKLDSNGIITYANIITPTAQNLRNMEDDIKKLIPKIIKKKKKDIIMDIEKLIRSYDPCFSCSTHFLKVRWI